MSAACIILAGGQGTRVRALHPDLPKPMIPVAGRPFLDWVIGYAADQGLGRAVISAGYRADIIEQRYAGQRPRGVVLSIAVEDGPQGTAGGFMQAAMTAPADILIAMNGDSLTLAPLDRHLDCFQHSTADAAVLGVRVDDASRFGTLDLDADCWLRAFNEKRPGPGIINAGVYIFRRELLAEFPATRPLSFEFDVFPLLLAKGKRIRAYVSDAPFLDIGTPESLGLADRFVSTYLQGGLPA